MALGQNLSQIYQNQLGRAPDQSGIDYWNQQLQSGMSLDDVRAGISGSQEGQQYATTGQQQYVAPNQQISNVDYRTNLGTVAPAPQVSSVAPRGQLTSAQLNQMYQSSLGRSAGIEGAEFYLGSGKTPEQIAAEIAASPEAQQYAASGQQRYVDPSQQYSDVNYRYNVDPNQDPAAQTTRGQTGLYGAETEYQRGLDRSARGLEDFTGTIKPWAEGGRQAYDLQLAQSGALGPEAQAQAYQQYKESPGQDWLREQSMREVENYAAATGQTMSGNVLDEINRRAMGRAMQDYGSQYERLGGLSRTGGQAASVLGQGYLGSGQFDAGMMQRLGDVRYKAGQDIASTIGQTATSLANLQTGMGATDASLFGQGAGNITNMINTMAEQSGQTPMQVATLLANMATQQGSQQAPYASAGGVYDARGTAGAYDAYGNALQGTFDAFGSMPAPTSSPAPSADPGMYGWALPTQNYNSGAVNPVDYSSHT